MLHAEIAAVYIGRKIGEKYEKWQNGLILKLLSPGQQRSRTAGGHLVRCGYKLGLWLGGGGEKSGDRGSVAAHGGQYQGSPHNKTCNCKQWR